MALYEMSEPTELKTTRAEFEHWVETNPTVRHKLRDVPQPLAMDANGVYWDPTVRLLWIGWRESRAAK